MGVDDDRRDDEYACRRACRHDVVVVWWSLIALRLVDLGMDHGGRGVLPFSRGHLRHADVSHFC